MLARANKTLSVIDLMNEYQHEIKAPLSIIDGILSNDLYDRETQRRIILEQVSRGTQLIGMMNSVLRGKREPQCKPLNILPLIRRCALLFENHVHSIIYKTTELPLIQGDKDDLSILFINIFKNATEAKKPKHPLKLQIKTFTSKTTVWVSITDTGVGMDRNQIELLWTGYNESSKDTGSGIGLSTVKRIADEHGAVIDVSARKGEGTTFVFGFPILECISRKNKEPFENLCLQDKPL